MDALLPPYVDGEASAADRARVVAHLERCAECRAAAEAQQQVRDLLQARRGTLGARPPATLAASVRAAAGAGPSPVLGWRGRLSAMAAAAALVLAVGGVMWATGRSPVLLAAQLTLDHIKCFIIDGDDHAHPFTPAGAEAAMTEQFGWSVPIPAPPARPDVHLVAVRRCLYGEGMVAHVLYRVAGQPVSLFVMPDSQAAAAEFSAFGRHAEVRSQGGVTYVLVAPAELGGVAAAVGLEAE
ncbi:MAG: zf-HC2 domain-containing protein [Vicinamibacterales bacterium]